MAKKAVATFRQKGAASVVKVIVPVKNEKTGAYSFKEEIVATEAVQTFIKNTYKE